MNHLSLRSEFEAVLKNYHASEQTKKTLQTARIALLDGPSASGRNSIINELVQTQAYLQMVSDTTRQPRVNNGVPERDGVEYWFKTEQQFLEGLQKGLYVEAAIIHDQQVSGVSVAEINRVQAQNKIAINDIQSDGVEAFRQYNPEAACFFIVPPSFNEWENRLTARGPMTEVERIRRVKSAVMEIEHALKNDYYRFVVNDQLTNAAHRVDELFHNPAQKTKLAREVATTLLIAMKQLLAALV